ncbi:MAG: hypothetical protein KDA92_03725 [Planctomycetales bacterium]|nr:hypothetical protein [Planctomycetales bacterium]
MLTRLIGRKTLAACAGLLALSMSSAARAQDDVAPLPSLASPEIGSSAYDVLLDRLQATEARVRQLEEEKQSPVVWPTGDDEIIKRLTRVEQTVKSEKKFPTARLTGFAHLDGGWHNQDLVNRANLGDIQDGLGFRRARLQAVGNLTDDVKYSVEMDFATAGRPSFMDVWAEQTNLPLLGNLRIGHFRQATTMDALTSVRQLEFLERSTPFQAFDPFRRLGIMAYDKSDDGMWSWAYSGYKTGAFNNAPLGDTRFATDYGDNGGYSFATRLTHLLYYDKCTDGGYLLHIGGHYNYSRTTASLNNPVPFYQSTVIPEFFIGDPAGGGLTANDEPAFLNTGRLAARDFHFFGFQLAAQDGPAHIQAEYMGTSVNQIGNRAVYYDGAYVQAGYFLTGEHRTYNQMFGVFDKVTPHENFFGSGRRGHLCGLGAWEVTGRWSYVNLQDSDAVAIAVAAGPPPTPNAGRMHETTVGVNWYWNPNTKLQLCWMHCFLDTVNFGDSDCDIFAGRFAFEF